MKHRVDAQPVTWTFETSKPEVTISSGDGPTRPSMMERVFKLADYLGLIVLARNIGELANEVIDLITNLFARRARGKGAAYG